MRFSSIFVVGMTILSQAFAEPSLRQKLKDVVDELEESREAASPVVKVKEVVSELQDATPYANDDCFGAINLDDFIGRPYNDNGMTSPLSDIPPCMSPYTRSGQIRGRWFRVTGTGNQMTASTCGFATFDTVIQVFSGSCGGLQCVAQNDNDPNCGTPNRSTVTFSTTPGVLNYILVYGYESAGSFEILVTENTNPPPPTPGTNTNCQSAHDLSNGMTLSGRTTGRNYVDYFGACGDATESTTGQAWYRVTASSGNSVVETCLTHYLDMDTQVSVFSGSCGNLQCISGADDNCGDAGKQASVPWRSSSGTSYYVVVHGFGPGFGDFTVSFSS